VIDADLSRAHGAEELIRIVDNSITLRAGYLERMQRAQEVEVEVLRQRSENPVDPLDASALVAAAFAAASMAHARSSGEDFASVLDRAMRTIGGDV
jgi:hypothetical protein